ncbi:hypothetical protein BGZ65_001572 [Modicella reniformis]|uniref:Protein kinase domain-containing protein n=1 Tax=Modicella reniformis TaxID=1440133 RepID=A0A9P6MBI5_9FUNG|nr:hypothetical protein BGZ65_001572 [Modicella reniformis]
MFALIHHQAVAIISKLAAQKNNKRIRGLSNHPRDDNNRNELLSSDPSSIIKPSLEPEASSQSFLPVNDLRNSTTPQDSLKDQTHFSLTLDCSKHNLLGHGRHAEVYKAVLHPFSTPMKQYLISRKGKHSLSCLQSDNEDLFCCAAKCLNTDTDSQSLGLAEAKILRRLHTSQALHPGRQYLVDYFGIYEKSTKRGISAVHGVEHDLAVLNENHEREWLLLLEYCQHGSIWDWIRQYPEKVGFRQWLTWAIQLLQATSCIHEAGLIHHDIKPHNILLNSALDAKLSDFGAGIFLHGESDASDTTDNAQPVLTLEEGRGRGTLPYAAPEMFASASGAGRYDQAIDIYSLGVSLYVIGLTAQEPFHKLKSVMEMIVWIKKGGFWLWEDQGWVHDRGPVPKPTPNYNYRLSASSGALGQIHQNQGQVRKHRRDMPRSSKTSSSSSSNMSTPNLPPINTQLSYDRGLLSPSSACSMNSPMVLPLGAANQSLSGYSPEKSARSSQPATPISPLPLPSPILRSQTPRSMGRKDEQRKSGEIVMRFLNGEVVQPEVILLLKEMCHPAPDQRPSASSVLQRLLAIQDQLNMDTNTDVDMDMDMDMDMI